ncbi:MerR family transcriptional regulator [Diplocloster modestus]|uniref:hypothetical protein n=1 Tax=Diplocloster modestus TaxID=2850322 RepID=UPI001EE7A2D3|nr:hypothetical protein [Diplocloster modestus]
MLLHDLEPDSIQPIVHVLDLHGGIGTGKVRELTNEMDCYFVLWVGSERLIKKRFFR